MGPRTRSTAAWPQREARPTPGAGRHSTLGLSQAAWGLGLNQKVLKVLGQETLWVPGTPCSTAGGSDVELRPCSLLAERGPRVGCLCPLPGLCQRVLGRPTVALAPKSRLGLPARRELCASKPSGGGAEGMGPGRRLGSAPRRLSPGPRTVHCWTSPELPVLSDNGVAGNRKDFGTHRVHTEVPQADLSVVPASFGDGLCAGSDALFLKHQGTFVRLSHTQSEVRLRAGPSAAADARVSGFY